MGGIAYESFALNRMKIVLLTLSGDPAAAIRELDKRYPDAEIESIAREQIEKLSATGRVQFLRLMHPNIFCVATERLVWQRGQNAFLLLGALAGSRRTIIVDAHGAQRQESRAHALVNA